MLGDEQGRSAQASRLSGGGGDKITDMQRGEGTESVLYMYCPVSPGESDLKGPSVGGMRD